MKQKYAFLLSFLITGLIFSNIHLYFLISKPELESVIISRAIDADTLVLSDGRIIRLLNINSPEKSSPLSIKPKEYIEQFEGSNAKIQIINKDRYKRNLARIYTSEGKYLNLELVSMGLASTFLVSSDESKKFKKAEIEAIKKEKGIWKHSEFYNCLSSEIDKNSELVIIKSICDKIQLESWTLKDESRKTFTFPKIQLKNTSEITLHSNGGKNNISDIYWDQKNNVWNNDRDTLYIFDSNNSIVHFNSYGY